MQYGRSRVRLLVYLSVPPILLLTDSDLTTHASSQSTNTTDANIQHGRIILLKPAHRRHDHPRLLRARDPTRDRGLQHPHPERVHEEGGDAVAVLDCCWGIRACSFFLPSLHVAFPATIRLRDDGFSALTFLKTVPYD